MLHFKKTQIPSSSIILTTTLFIFGISGCSTDRKAKIKVASPSKETQPAKKVEPKPQPNASKIKHVAKANVQSLPLFDKDAYHSVYSFIDNYALAHQAFKGGFFLSGQGPLIAKYLNFNRPWKTWKINQKVSNQHVAIAKRNIAWLSIPLSKEQAKSSMLSLSLKSAALQGVTININKKKVGKFSLKKDENWQFAQLAIPNGILVEGENKIEFSFANRGTIGNEKKSYAALEWLYLGKEALEQSALVRKDKNGHLHFTKDQSLAYYIQPYQGSKLGLNYDANAKCDFEITLQSEGKKLKPLILHENASTTNTEFMVSTSIDLDAIANKVARVEIKARGENCKSVQLSDVAIYRKGKRPKLDHSSKPKHVLFWLVDNWRADHFRVYNPKSRVETPVMSRLAEEGASFEAYITGTESKVSHAAIWTGMFPKQHRFIGKSKRIPEHFVTIAEAMKKAGLLTLGCSANGHITKKKGFGDGWVAYRNTLHKGGGLTAERLTDLSIGMLDKYLPKAENGFYLYVGTIDPHVSWKGRQPWLNRYDPGPYKGQFKKRVAGPVWDKLAGRPKSVKPRDRQRVLAIYDSTISYNDKHLGELLSYLEKKGIRDETMIVITADHGEEFWERGKIGHGSSVRDTVVRVPLIIHYPPLFGKGVRVKEGVDVNSIMATILDAIGADIPDTVQAESLLPLAQGVSGGYPRARFASQYELAYAMRIADFKIWIGGKGEPRIYDMTRPLAENHDVVEKHPFVTRMLSDALSLFLNYQSRWRQSRWGVPNNLRPQFDADFRSSSLPEAIR